MSNTLKISIENTKVMVSDDIRKDFLSKGKVDLCDAGS